MSAPLTEPSAAPVVSVVIPVRDGATWLPGCLAALASQQGTGTFEVIVVDNASRDGSAAVARAHPVVSEVIVEEKPGSYAARNAGVAIARAPVLAFTDVDCTPEPGWLAHGLSALETTGADLVGGAIQADASPQPTLWERYDRAVYLRQEDVVVNLGWAVTANLFVRRVVFDAVGRFDAGLVSGGDREFCLRAGRRGFAIAYAEDAVVRHRPRTTAGEIWRVNRRIGVGFAALRARQEVPPWWRTREHWMRLDWVIHLMTQDGTARLRRRQVLPVHGLAMSARLSGRFGGWLRGARR
jgi:glycosyltransferase involved in cell wall biosynthesis